MGERGSRTSYWMNCMCKASCWDVCKCARVSMSVCESVPAAGLVQRLWRLVRPGASTSADWISRERCWGQWQSKPSCWRDPYCTYIIYSPLIGLNPEQPARGAGCGHCCRSCLREYWVCLLICAAGHVYNVYIPCICLSLCVCLLAHYWRNRAQPRCCLDLGTRSCGSLISTGLLDSASP